MELINRRRFAVENFLYLTALITLAAGCEPKKIAPQSVSQKAPIDWSKLPALERIRRLELLQVPSVPDFNHTTELITATSEFYTEEVPTTKTSVQLQNSVNFLSPEKFLDALIKDTPSDSNETEEETRQLATIILEFVSRKDRTVYVNDQKVSNMVQANITNHALRRSLAGRDMRVVLTKSILFHTYSHAVSTSEEVNIEPAVGLENLPGKPIVQKFIGFDFVGTYPDGRKFLYTGATEALTEYTARLVARKTGSALGIPTYLDGVTLVDMINTRSRMQPETFKQIYAGRQSTQELLASWGTINNPASPNIESAKKALFTIGVRTNNPELISQHRATTVIQELLGFR